MMKSLPEKDLSNSSYAKKLKFKRSYSGRDFFHEIQVLSLSIIYYIDQLYTWHRYNLACQPAYAERFLVVWFLGWRRMMT